MVNMIKRDPLLRPYLKSINEIEDAGIRVDVAENIEEKDCVAIKVDDFYSKQHLERMPKAVDFVVVVDCQCDAFAMYIMEFKNVCGPNFLDIAAIQEKFSQTIDGFLKGQFSEIFENDRYKYKVVKLYLVSDAYHETGRFASHEEYLAFRQKINEKDTLKVDASLSGKLYRFRGKILRIQYEIPPNPIIKKL